MLRVRHREDNLLQTNVARIMQEQETGKPPDMVDKIHRALLRFLDEKLTKHQFKSEQEIQDALDGWYYYAMRRNLELDEVWEAFTIRDGVIQTVVGGMGGPFCCATIEDIGTREKALA